MLSFPCFGSRPSKSHQFYNSYYIPIAEGKSNGRNAEQFSGNNLVLYFQNNISLFGFHKGNPGFLGAEYVSNSNIIFFFSRIILYFIAQSYISLDL